MLRRTGLCRPCVRYGRAKVATCESPSEAATLGGEQAIEFSPGTYVLILKPDLSAAEALFDEWQEFAVKTANSMGAGLDWFTRKGLENAALLGLWEAAQTFNPQKGFKFISHASQRVVGAVKDEMRRADEVHGRAGCGYWKDREKPKRFSLSQMMDGRAGGQDDGQGRFDLPDVSQFPSDDISLSKDLIERFYSGLSENESIVLSGRLAEKSMDVISKEINLSEARVSQIWASLRDHCKKILEQQSA